MGKNAWKEGGRQRGQINPVSQLKLALGRFMRETLYETVVAAGMAHVLEVLEAERAEVCGPRYRHDGGRTAYRAGGVPSSLVLAGRRVQVKRPRVRRVGGEEVELPSWAAWSAEDPLEERAVEQMLVGVSTRKYARSLESLPEELSSAGTGKSAVSERFVRGTQKQLSTVQERDLSGLDLKVLFLDGVYFRGEHVILVAVGLDASGQKQVLGIWEGASEHHASCTALLESLTERGLRSDRSLLVVLDGSKALAKAVRAVFGKRALVQRCQEHKKRNVLDALPQSKRASVKQALNTAYRTADASRAQCLLQNLIRSLEGKHPGAAASLREGLDELLTVKQLALGDEALERTLSTTNLIENLIGQVRDLSRRVKRWRGGTMMLRWSAAGVLEAERHFRRVRGCKGMGKLIAALDQHDAQLDATRAPKSAVVAAA